MTWGSIPGTVPVPSVFSPVNIGPLRLRNRVVKAATSEGMTPGGDVTERLVEHHAALARGGVGMTTVAYGAVEPAGRTFGDQLLMERRAISGLRELTEAVHREGARASVQLTHCGFFSKLRGPDGRAPRGPSGTVNLYGALVGLPWAPAMDRSDIHRVVGAFGRAAMVAEEAGFDAVEIHVGHGYLLSQFASPATNRRDDEYGGDLEGRMRIALEVVARVRDAVGGRLAILAKTNLSDGIPGGLEVPGAVEAGRLLAGAGVDAVIPSGGFTSKNAFYLLRGGRPLEQMIEVEESPAMRMALRLFGPQVIQRYPFEEMFFREDAARLVEALDVPVGLLGGVVSRENLDRAMAGGFAFVVMGRALIADPDLVNRMQAGETDRTRCNACNQCVAEMDRNGVRCVLDD